MTFAALGLAPVFLPILDRLGYREPTPVQQKAIPPILEGRDVMAGAQTGTGKTAAFALPLIQRLDEADYAAEPNTMGVLVLVPTRELAQQVSESFRTYGRTLGLRCTALFGGVPMAPQIEKLARAPHVVVATPGRLLDLARQPAIHFHRLQTLVLDEADRMLDLGFARDLNTLFGLIPAKRQTLLFSATLSPAVRQLVAPLLHQPVSIAIAAPHATAQGIRQWVVPVDKKRKAALFCYLYKQKAWDQVLVFVKTRKGVEELAETLAAKGIPADTIHGDKPQPARLQAWERFKRGEARVLVATDVAARGLDIEQLPRVVNFDLPTVPEDYVHRIGRTARAGATGEAVSLVCADEVNLLGAIEVLIHQPLKRIEQHGFEPEHRVPETGPGGQVIRQGKPRKGPGPAAPGARRAGAPSPSRRSTGKPVAPGRKSGPNKPGGKSAAKKPASRGQ